MARDLSYSDFQTFVDEKGLEKPCVECGENEWLILGGTEDSAGEPGENYMFLASLPELIDGPFPAPRSFANYVMYCSNCGVIKLIAAPVVWDWQDRRHG